VLNLAIHLESFRI